MFRKNMNCRFGADLPYSWINCIYIDCSGFILSASKVSANKKENGGGLMWNEYFLSYQL